MVEACASPVLSPAVPFRSLTGSGIQEDRLVRQAQEGNLEAYNQLVQQHQDRVFRQAYWLLNEEEAAEDAAQEAFIRAYRKLDTFRGGPFLPWLLQITTNYCLDQLRSANRRRTQPLETYNEEGDEIENRWIRDPGDSPEQALERSELEAEIITSVQKLPVGFRMPIILIDIQGLNYGEASAVMQIPVGTFKSRLSRARQKLCKDFQQKNLFGNSGVY